MEPETVYYKGYRLNLCWCGYPEMRWMIYHFGRWEHTAKTLKEAKDYVNKHLEL